MTGLNRTINLTSPDIHDVLRRRLTTNQNGTTWDITELIPNTDISWRQLHSMYMKSDHSWGTAGLVRTLCSTCELPADHVLPFTTNYDDTKEELKYLNQYDCRHYLRLFRRIVRSNTLGKLRNIARPYYGVQALMLRGQDPMSESESYLFNLFDNEKPLLSGNALIRYRVLEYFKTIRDPGSTFDLYFDALGCSSEEARRVLGMFCQAGLVPIEA